MAEDRLTACMVDDFIHDPVLAVRVIFGDRIPPLSPHQEARLWGMWLSTWMIDSSGFGTGKTRDLALFATLQALLFRNRTVGLISVSFRQVKEIFRYCETWAKNVPLIRSELSRTALNTLQIVHGQEAVEIDFRNESSIRGVPPDIMGQSERVKSESWTCGCFDEWTAYGHTPGFGKFLVGRVRKPIPECYPIEDPLFGQHFVFTGTAKDSEHPCHERVKVYRTQIAQKDSRYELQSWNFEHVPDRLPRFKKALEQPVREMILNLPYAEVEQEVYGRWTADKSHFYSLADLTRCRVPHCKIMLEDADQAYIRVAGADVARGGMQFKNMGAKRSSGDDCSMMTWRFRADGTGKPQLIHGLRETSLQAGQYSFRIHVQNSRFGYYRICMDPQGGGSFVRDELRKPVQTDGREEFRAVPIIRADDYLLRGVGNPILVFANRGEPYFAECEIQFSCESEFVNRIHAVLRAAVQRGDVEFPEPWGGWPAGMDADRQREWLNQHQELPEDDRAAAEVDLAILQLASVSRETDRNGNIILDQHGQSKFSSKFKKDSAYSCAYGYFMYHCWREVMNHAKHKLAGKGAIVAGSFEV